MIAASDVADTPDLAGLLAAAQKAVRDANWSAWQPPPGDSWLPEHLFGDEPPLTGGILTAYLSLCAWIWQRPITPVEQTRVSDALVRLWTEDGVTMDYTRLRDVLSLVWLQGGLQAMPPAEQEAARLQLAAELPEGAFPGVDTAVPGAAAAAAAETKAEVDFLDQAPPPSPDVALDGLYQATTFGLQLDVYGPPGSGTWGTQTELYAFFPTGRYMYFPSRQEAGAELMDPKGHEEYRGSYEISAGQITLHDGSTRQTNASAYTASPDRTEITFYGKTFTRIADTTGLTPSLSG